MNAKETRDPTRRLVRHYLWLAGPILMLMLLRPDSDALTWLDGKDLTAWAAWVIAAGLPLLVAWKAYREFWRKDS